MTNEETAKLLSSMQISQAAIEITKVIVAKNTSTPMIYAESARLMVLAVAPHVQFPLQLFTADEVAAAASKAELDEVHLSLFQDFADYLVEGREKVLDLREVKLNVMVVEIEAMAASDKQFEPIEAAQLMLGALERLEEIAEL